MGKRRCSTDEGSDKNDVKPDYFAINARICQLVEGCPCMYDRAHPDYMKKDAMDAAWARIAEDTGDSVNACKDRWRNIRTSFARSINVHKTPASANRTKPYYLHEHIKFLERHITPGIPVPPRTKRTRGRSVEEARDESLDSSTSFGHRLMEASSCSENAPEERPYTQAEYANQIELLEVKPTLPLVCPCPPKKRPHLMGSYSQNDETNPSDLDSSQMPLSPPRSANPDAAFLQGLLPEMQAMNFAQKVSFKRRIYEVIDNIFSQASTSSGTRYVNPNLMPLNGLQQHSETAPKQSMTKSKALEAIVAEAVKNALAKSSLNEPTG